MAQYKQSDISNVYWASNDGFKGGRDPMGIQNSSVATYTELLPGLTNLTGHIRYYSLYCWLLDEYDRLEKNEQQSLHQYNFIRRSELIMALLMKDKGVRAVVGALFISQGNCKVVDGGVYDIGDGADFESHRKYWSFISGAFGQYYLGSLIFYELVKIEEGRFYLGQKGKQLANAFRNSVDKDVRELYLYCILEGGVSEKELEDLYPMGLNQITVGSEEWNALNNLLIMEDADGTSLRRQTVFLMLKDINSGVSVEDFPHYRFLHVNDDDMDAAFGWYFYYLCEALHYCIESFFCLVLNKIDELRNPPVSILLNNIQDGIIANIEGYIHLNSVEEWKLCIEGRIDEMMDDLKEDINSGEYLIASSKAFILLLRLYKELEYNKDLIRDFENSYDLVRQRGIFSEGLKSYVAQHLKLSIPEYIKTIVLQTMQEHTIVAIGKMGNNNSDLRKFIMEDGRVVLVEKRTPTNTTPRIFSLFNFLQDLSYLDKEGHLTKIAYKYIEDYGKE